MNNSYVMQVADSYKYLNKKKFMASLSESFLFNSCRLTTYKWLNHNLDTTDPLCVLLADGSLFSNMKELNRKLSDKEAMNFFLFKYL